MLSSNVGQYVPATDQGAEPYVALRLLAGLFGVLAVLVAIGGGLVAVVVVLGTLGSAGAAARFAPGPVVAGILGAGLAGGLVITLVTVFNALLFWGGAQAIRALLSIDGRTRDIAAQQRQTMLELRRISSGPPTPNR